MTTSYYWCPSCGEQCYQVEADWWCPQGHVIVNPSPITPTVIDMSPTGSMTWVEKLAAAKCPCNPEEHCDGCWKHRGDVAGYLHDEGCEVCQGTRAAAPGLQKICPCIESFRTGEDSFIRCIPCTDCSDARSHSATCEGWCQGRGWVLIPEKELTMPLILEFLALTGEATIGKAGKGHRFEEAHDGFYIVLNDFERDGEYLYTKEPSLNETIAHAICQARGIE
jgi:hypothetical protein